MNARRRREDRKLGGPAAAALLAGLVVTGCLIGALTRPIGLLAPFWPTNAIMVGVLLRIPAARSPLGWLAGALAYLGTDLALGASLQWALLLNGANLASVAGAFAVLRRLPAPAIALRDPAALPLILLGALAGSVAGGIGGMLANPLLFGGSAVTGFGFWFATELTNYIAVLPVLLSLPSALAGLAAWRRPTGGEAAPVLALLMSCLAAKLVGGPGAIAFILPALLWCGSVHSVFLTALLTMCAGIWAVAELIEAYLPVDLQVPNSFAMASYRLGVSFVLLVPICQAIVIQARRSVIDRLTLSANEDSLTRIANRRAFLERSEALLAADRAPAAVLMLDIDHFKRINDSFGHAAGDAVLAEIARRIAPCLRQGDVFGRLGGEEFALVLAHSDTPEGLATAERCRRAVADAPFEVRPGQEILVTASIGLATTAVGERAIAPLLERADLALYTAKQAGRDRVEVFAGPHAVPPA